MTFVNFSSGYQAPGVYVEQISTQVAPTVTSLNASVVALVGPTRGYMTATEGISLAAYSATTPVLTTLSHTGVDPASVQIISLQGIVYSNPAATAPDFTVTIVPGINAGASTAQIGLASGSLIPPGTVVYVTYNYTDDGYFFPQLFTSFQSLLNTYGQPLDSNNNVISPVSLVAQFVFSNGGAQVLVVPTPDVPDATTKLLVATKSGFLSAYAKMASLTNIGIVVPIPFGMTGTPTLPGDLVSVANDLANDCDNLSLQGNLRVGYVGYEPTVTITPDSISTSVQAGRIVNFWPYSLQYYNGLSNQTVNVGSYCLAGAAAGFSTSNFPQTPLTRQVMNGFSGISKSILSAMTLSFKNNLSSKGVAVLEPNSNNALVIRHGVTTLGTSVMTQEISLVRAADYMILEVKMNLDNSGLIGSPTTANSPTQVQGLVLGVLEYLVAQGVIVAYTGLTAVLLATNPTVIAVTYAYAPSYPLNYITVAFTVDTSSGSVAPTAANAAPTPA